MVTVTVVAMGIRNNLKIYTYCHARIFTEDKSCRMSVFRDMQVHSAPSLAFVMLECHLLFIGGCYVNSTSDISNVIA